MGGESVGEVCRECWGGVQTYLGGDDEVVALPAVLLDGLAHDNLRLAGGVDLGAVEKVDAAVVGGLHAGKGALCWLVSIPLHHDVFFPRATFPEAKTHLCRRGRRT